MELEEKIEELALRGQDPIRQNRPNEMASAIPL